MEKDDGAIEKIEKKKRFLICAAYWAALIALCYVFFKHLAPLFMPFILGFILALLLRPLTLWLSKKLRVSVKASGVVTVILLYGVVGVLLATLSSELFGYLRGVLTQLPDFYTEKIAPALSDAYASINEALARSNPDIAEAFRSAVESFISTLGDKISSVSVTALSWASGLASRLPRALVALLIMIISTFFIAADYDGITGFISRQLGESKSKTALEVKRAALDTTGRLLRSYALILGITFCELTLGYFILGVEYFPLLAALTALLDIFPVVGTGTIVLPWAAISLLNGAVTRGVGLIILYVIITVIRQIIEPKIVGAHVGLHPIVTLMSMYVGTLLFGALGLFGLPLAVSILNELNNKGIIHLFK